MWKQIRIWILLSWSFLTIGILLGSWWAYHELGWGGWWVWDPVENASLMPWLLATASIHSITKSKLNYWTLICAQGTFVLSIVGTFFVRSGLLSSVHSFATDSTRGLYLLIFLFSISLISLINWNSSSKLKPTWVKFCRNYATLWFNSSKFMEKESFIKETSVFRFTSMNHRLLVYPTFVRPVRFSEKEKRLSNLTPVPCDLNLTPVGPPFRGERKTNVLNLTVPILLGIKNGKSMVTTAQPLYYAFEKNSELKTHNQNLFDISTKQLLEQLLLLQNFYFCIICLVVFWGTSAPIIFQWFWNRDVGTGAPFYNGTLIPLFTSVFFVLIFVHYTQFLKFNKKYIEFVNHCKPTAVSSGKNFPLDTAALLSVIIQSSFKETQVKPILYCTLFFTLNFLIALYFLGLNLFNSIYSALCFLLISSIIISNDLFRKPNRLGDTPVSDSSTRDTSKSLTIKAPFAKRSVSLEKTCVKETLVSYFKRKINAYLNLTGPSFLNRICVMENHSLSNRLIKTRKSFLTQFSSVANRFFILTTNLQRAKNVCTNAKLEIAEDIKESRKNMVLKIPESSKDLLLYQPRSKDEMNISHIGLVFFIIGIFLSNTFKLEFTEQLHSGPFGVRLGSQICYLRSIDHSFAPTFHSICANILIYPHRVCLQPDLSKGAENSEMAFRVDLMDSTSFYTYNKNIQSVLRSDFSFKSNGYLASIFKPATTNEQKDILVEPFKQAFPNFVVCMFPEKRFYYSNQGAVATKVAIQSNLFTDFYSLIGTGSFETGWFTTIMKLPFIFCIWLGFSLGVIGGLLSLKKQVQKSKLYWI